jgi:DNA polymerase epsilon subunit 2
MTDGRQLTIIKVFRKYSHSLGPDALQFLEEILERHDIADNDVEFSIETIAREYNKQDDASMKVSLDILRRVYDALQDQGNPGEAEELLDPDSHLYFVDAFEMPSWHWSQERGTFEKCPSHCRW